MGKTKEIANILAVFEDAVTYLENLKDLKSDFDPTTFLLAVGGDSLKALKGIPDLVPEISGLELDDSHAVLCDVICLVYRALHLVVDKKGC